MIQPFKLSASYIVSYFIRHTDYLMWQDPQKQLTTSNCVCAGGRRRGTWGSGWGGGRPWRHTGRVLNSCQSNRHLNIHALSQKTAFGFISSNSWRFISHLLSWKRNETNWPNIQMFFLVHFEALFNCIMTIMNMSFNSSLIGECCSCEARDNHCTSTPFGFYFNWSLLAFPPAVFHLTAPMKENWPFLFFKLLMF